MIEKISSISSKEEFIEYLQDLATDYTDNRDEWENQTISDYLEQIASWIEEYSISPANDIEWEKIDFKILAQLLSVCCPPKVLGCQRDTRAILKFMESRN